MRHSRGWYTQEIVNAARPDLDAAAPAIGVGVQAGMVPVVFVAADQGATTLRAQNQHRLPIVATRMAEATSTNWRSPATARAERHRQPALIGRVLVNTGEYRGCRSSERQPLSDSCVFCSMMSLRILIFG